MIIILWFSFLCVICVYILKKFKLINFPHGKALFLIAKNMLKGCLFNSMLAFFSFVSLLKLHTFFSSKTHQHMIKRQFRLEKKVPNDILPKIRVSLFDYTYLAG